KLRALNDHEKVHTTSATPHVCETCGKSFRSLPYLILHQRKHRERQPRERQPSLLKWLLVVFSNHLSTDFPGHLCYICMCMDMQSYAAAPPGSSGAPGTDKLCSLYIICHLVNLQCQNNTSHEIM
uniref:C2H2-type domain-containing protein n=1 Tax=Amphiprion ocellaris TaxID=80972 RepID=A0AAQ5Y882_AMPOC